MKYGTRVQETTTTTGTGTLSLLGATDGHRTFLSEIGDGEVTPYLLTTEAGAWERGWGEVATGSPPTITRNVVKSSNGDALLDLPSGTHTVTNVAEAALFNETVRSTDVRHVVSLTQTEYDELDPRDPATLYIVTPDD
jgi:hypothetical protein